MIGIFLDDERNPEDVTWVEYPENIDWAVVRTSADFFCALNNLDPGYISFDHDIQEFFKTPPYEQEETTGYDILKRMIDTYLLYNLSYTFPKCFFHTQNPVGKQNMECYYQNFLKYMEEVYMENKK